MVTTTQAFTSPSKPLCRCVLASLLQVAEEANLHLETASFKGSTDVRCAQTPKKRKASCRNVRFRFKRLSEESECV